MKKTIVLAAACLFGMAVMAAETSYIRITLKSASGTTDYIRLTADDAYTNDYENAADADKMMSLANTKSVLLYAYVGDHTCGSVVAADLTGLQLGFTTNQTDKAYTLTFDQFSGQELTLYDAVEKKYVTINASTPDYDFTVTDDQVGRIAITDRFALTAAAPSTPSICHQNGHLEITAYQGASVKVLAYADESEVIAATAITAAYQEIELKDLAAGQYIVVLTTADGDQRLVIKK